MALADVAGKLALMATDAEAIAQEIVNLPESHDEGEQALRTEAVTKAQEAAAALRMARTPLATIAGLRSF